MFYAPVAAVGESYSVLAVTSYITTVDTPADQTYDLPNAGAQDRG